MILIFGCWGLIFFISNLFMSIDFVYVEVVCVRNWFG